MSKPFLVSILAVATTATLCSAPLAGVSERWIRRNWQFRPSITGDYIVPISYQLST
jgi:hypothetical protein